MISHLLISAALAFSASFVEAQSAAGLSSLINKLSVGCQSSSGTLLTSNFGTCSNVIGLIPVISASESVIAPLGSWITDVCKLDVCPSDVVASAQSNIQTGCASDVKNNVATAVALTTIVTNYKQIRDLVCIQSSSNSTFCLITLLTSLQNATNSPITVSMVENILTSGLPALAPLLKEVPSSAYCTDCGHAVMTQLSKVKSVTSGNSTTSVSNSSSTTSSISDKCGASFLDGQIPSSVNIVNDASSKSTAKNSAAISVSVDLVRSSLVASVVATVASVFL